MFASSGETTAPCGVPTFVSDHWPSSDTPAFNHFWIRRRIRRSATRCSMNFIVHSWFMLVKFQQRYQVRNGILRKALPSLELRPFGGSQKSAPVSPPILGAAAPSYVLQSPGFVENCVGLYVPLLEFNQKCRNSTAWKVEPSTQ